MKAIQSAKLFLVAILVSLTTGCVTQKVWSGTKEHYVCAPASPPNLALFATRRDEMLVQYDTVNPRNQQVIRRAYWLDTNQTRIASGKKPKFTDTAAANGLLPVPVLDENTAAGTNHSSSEIFAVVTADGREFMVHRPGQRPELHRLPAYDVHSSLGMRTALTPLAVAADGALVGSLLMFIGSGGNPDAFQNDQPK